MAKVITFFGADAKVGTSMLAQSIAEELTARKKKTLFIQASSLEHDSYIDTKGAMTIDELWPIDPEELTEADVKRIILKHNGLSFIAGIVHPFKMRYFSEILLVKIRELMDKDFDYIVIDGGRDYQYPLPLSALLAADLRYYVMVPDQRSVERFNSTNEHLLKNPHLNTNLNLYSAIVVNKWVKNLGVYSPDQIEKNFGMDIHVVPAVANAAACEVTKQTLSRIRSEERR